MHVASETEALCMKASLLLETNKQTCRRKLKEVKIHFFLVFSVFTQPRLSDLKIPWCLFVAKE